MATYTHDNPELMETRQKMIVFKRYSQQAQQGWKLFKRVPHTTGFVDRMKVAGLPTFRLKGEGQPVAFGDGVQGTRYREVIQTFALGYRISHEAMKDDQHDILNRMPGDLGDSARDYQERLMADVINDQFTGSIFTGLDALALMSSAHTSLRPEVGNRSNIISPAADLDVTGLEAIMTLRRTAQSEEGRYIEVGQSVLCVHPALEHRAYVLLNTQMRPGTANNDVNTVVSSRSGLTVMSWPFKSSQTNWSVHDSPEKNGLEVREREELTFAEAKDSDTFDRKFYAYFRWKPILNDWVGNFGSNFS